MSLDLSPTPETTREISQTSSSPPAPDSVEALSQRSGVPAAALARLSPDELSGLQRLEADVARATEAPGRMTPEALRAVTEARDQVRADVASRHVGSGDSMNETALVDADFRIQRPPSGTGPELGVESRPPDAHLQIRDQEITIGSDIYIHGAGATPAIAKIYEEQIEAEWGRNPGSGEPWTYTDPDTENVYTVKFDVHVGIYDPTNPETAPLLAPGETPSDRDNFISVIDKEESSYVTNGESGEWRLNGRDGSTLIADNPAAHEFGHLVGLEDRYTKDGPLKGWEGNIMAEPAGAGRVWQEDIDLLVKSRIDEFNKAGAPEIFDVSINP